MDIRTKETVVIVRSLDRKAKRLRERLRSLEWTAGSPLATAKLKKKVLDNRQALEIIAAMADEQRKPLVGMVEAGRDDGVPVIMATVSCSHLDNDEYSTCAFLCPYCLKMHIHGAMPGHRVAHCVHDSPYQRTGYIIKLVTD